MYNNYSNSSEDSEGNLNNESIALEDIQQDEQTEITSPIYGSYTGQAQLLSSTFVFSQSELILSDQGTFELITNEVSLAALANPRLKIDDIYPSISITSTGFAVLQDQQVGSLKIQSLELSAILDKEGNPVVADEQQVKTLIAELNALGIVIPTAEEEAPLNIDVQYAFNADDNSIIITSQPEAPLSLVYEGVQ